MLSSSPLPCDWITHDDAMQQDPRRRVYPDPLLALTRRIRNIAGIAQQHRLALVARQGYRAAIARACDHKVGEVAAWQSPGEAVQLQAAVEGVRGPQRVPVVARAARVHRTGQASLAGPHFNRICANPRPIVQAYLPAQTVLRVGDDTHTRLLRQSQWPSSFQPRRATS